MEEIKTVNQHQNHSLRTGSFQNHLGPNEIVILDENRALRNG